MLSFALFPSDRSQNHTHPCKQKDFFPGLKVENTAFGGWEGQREHESQIEPIIFTLSLVNLSHFRHIFICALVSLGAENFLVHFSATFEKFVFLTAWWDSEENLHGTASFLLTNTVTKKTYSLCPCTLQTCFFSYYIFLPKACIFPFWITHTIYSAET